MGINLLQSCLFRLLPAKILVFFTDNGEGGFSHIHRLQSCIIYKMNFWNSLGSVEFGGKSSNYLQAKQYGVNADSYNHKIK